ncbi:MAG: galactose oxidase early set domain-containing protein, partial [Rhodoglobus sp.]
TDTFTNIANETAEWSGPGTSPNPNLDSLIFYPRTHHLTTGNVFMSGFVQNSSTVDHVTTLWNPFPGQNTVPSGWNQIRVYGTSVRFPNIGAFDDWIVRIGGSVEISPGPPAITQTTNTVEVINAADPFAGWANTHALNRNRSQLNCVALPDSSLLVLGGVDDQQPNPPIYQLEPELYKPGLAPPYHQWNLLPPAASVRDYHSTALLLTDGRVLVAGGENRALNGGFDYEVFTPPYLAPPGGGVPITPQALSINAPNDPNGPYYTLAANTTYAVQIAPLPLGTTVEKAVLMAPGSVTHHFDMSQRYHQLTSGQKTATSVRFTTPPAGNTLPGGIYMLFLVSNTGVPSSALWVKLP